MDLGHQRFRIELIAETSHLWRWQIFEGGRFVMQSAPVYATRGDANRAAIFEQSQLMSDIDQPLFPF
jgi:hypothetical protein